MYKKLSAASGSDVPVEHRGGLQMRRNDSGIFPDGPEACEAQGKVYKRYSGVVVVSSREREERREERRRLQWKTTLTDQRVNPGGSPCPERTRPERG
jgi:hypothetical protein